MLRAAALVLVLLLLGLPAVPARAYDGDTHETLTREALAGYPELDAPRTPPAPAALARFRIHVYGLLAADAAFRARYPTAERFDAWAFKDYLGLCPEARVEGFDDVSRERGSARDVIARASRRPDEDRRNQNRFAHDAERRILRDPAGRPLPADPATLEMGGLTGLSSQAHAHYQLLPGPKSDDPEVLKRDPAHFAVPPDAHSFGAVFAQRFFALAAIARTWDDPAAAYLADMFFGHALHYVQDVANQIHTVQVGIYDFFVDAKLEAYKEEVRSLGGLLRARPTFREIGIGIIKNHHLFAENLLAKRLREARDGGAVGRAALAAMRAGDAEYVAALAAALGPGAAPPDPWADPGQVVRLLVERSAPEGPEVYRLARRVAVPELSRVGFTLDDADDPDVFVRRGPGPEADRAALYRLETRGLARAATATRALWRHLGAATPGAAARLGAALAADADAMQAAAARRRAAYVPPAVGGRRINYGVPLGLLVVVLALGAAGRFLLRRRAARRGREMTR